MSPEQFEQVYELLAQAIDRAGQAGETLLLTKLVLTLAHEAGDLAVFERALAIAAQDTSPAKAGDVSAAGAGGV